jgi:hypothetical protein
MACVADTALSAPQFPSHKEAVAAFSGRDLTPYLRSYDRGALMALQARLGRRYNADIRFLAERFLAAADLALSRLSKREEEAIRDSVSDLNYWFVGLLYERTILCHLGRPTNVYVAQNIRHSVVGARSGYLKSIGSAVDRDALKTHANNFDDWNGNRVSAILEGQNDTPGWNALLARMLGITTSEGPADAMRRAWVALAHEKKAEIIATVRGQI